MFCFFCLEDCGKDEQKCSAHVIKCPQNIVPGQLYTPDNLIKEVNRLRCKREVIAYLMSNCCDLTERLAVIDSVSSYLKQLNVTIDRQDLKPPTPTPIVQPPVERDPYRYLNRGPPFRAQQPNPAIPVEPIIHVRRDPYPARPMNIPERRIPQQPNPRQREDNKCIFL